MIEMVFGDMSTVLKPSDSYAMVLTEAEGGRTETGGDYRAPEARPSKWPRLVTGHRVHLPMNC